MWFAHLPSMEIYHSETVIWLFNGYGWHSDGNNPQTNISWSQAHLLAYKLTFYADSALTHRLESFSIHTCVYVSYYHHHHFEPLKVIFRVNSTNEEKEKSISMWMAKIGHHQYGLDSWFVGCLIAFRHFFPSLPPPV